MGCYLVCFPSNNKGMNAVLHARGHYLNIRISVKCGEVIQPEARFFLLEINIPEFSEFVAQALHHIFFIPPVIPYFHVHIQIYLFAGKIFNSFSGCRAEFFYGFAAFSY